MRPPYSKGSLKKGVIISGAGEARAGGFDAKKLIGDLPRFRKMDRFSQFAAAAARLALRDAGRSLPENAAAVIASGFGPFESTERFLQGMAEHGSHLASAIMFPNTVMNMAAGMLSISFKIKGPTVTIAGKLEQAIELAADLILRGRADSALAGYVEEKNDRFPTEMDGAIIYVLEKG